MFVVFLFVIYNVTIFLYNLFIFSLFQTQSLLRSAAHTVLMADMVDEASIWRVLPQADWTIQAWENNRWDFTM